MSTDRNDKKEPAAEATKKAAAPEAATETKKQDEQPIDGLFTLHPADAKKVGF